MTDETSAQEAAVDAMAAAMAGWDLDHLADEDVEAWRASARLALDALFSPTKKPCAECGEGWIAEVVQEQPLQLSDIPCPNPNCTDGFVASPAPIEGLGWVKVSELERVGGLTPLGRLVSSHYSAPKDEPVFRLPSKVREEE